MTICSMPSKGSQIVVIVPTYLCVPYLKCPSVMATLDFKHKLYFKQQIFKIFRTDENNAEKLEELGGNIWW